MSCGYAHWDGGYVLGALSPAERTEFRNHLADCVECTGAVQELAGLPGLLARVPASVLESPPADEPVPETLLPGLVREVRRTHRRRRWSTAGVAAAATVAVAAGAFAVVQGTGGEPSVTAAPPASPGVSASVIESQGRAMAEVGAAASGMTARVAMTSVPWGTRLELTCSYPAATAEHGHPGHGDTGWRYALVVRTREGAVEQVATWNALPGKTMQLTAATAARRDDIASVEIRTAAGQPVLRLLS